MLSSSLSFVPKAKKNWEEEKKLFSLVLRLLGFYILLFQGQSLLISSETFPVPSQLRRGMGNTPVLTEKRGWEGRKHGKVTGEEGGGEKSVQESDKYITTVLTDAPSEKYTLPVTGVTHFVFILKPERKPV